VDDFEPTVVYPENHGRRESDVALNWGCGGFVFGTLFGVLLTLAAAFVYREFVR